MLGFYSWCTEDVREVLHFKLRCDRSIQATTRALYMTLGKVRRGTSRMHPMLPALSLQGAARAAFMASLSVGVTG
eukprot:1392873-Amorphochlora_amoeboformis.AAC.1